MNLLTFPIGEIFKYEHDTNELFLDIVYILCMENRPKPKLELTALLNHAKEVVLLFSDKIAEWAVNCEDTRIRIELVDKTDFCLNYKTVNDNSFIKLRPDFNIPIKRSYALYDAKNRKAKYIWMLDDDITVSRDNYLRAICALKQGKAVVGFHVPEYPDISTIDHIERIIYKRVPCISMTGSCMFLNMEKVTGYFPFVYNEDLFFYMQQLKANEVVSGGIVRQSESMPWLNFNRVRHEQFGDFIYNAFKKRFMNSEERVIQWSQEKEVQLKRLEDLSIHAPTPTLKNVLLAAEETMRNICIDEVKQFVYNCHFASWACKYVED